MLDVNKFNKIIAANWKLNASFDFIKGYFDQLNIDELKNNENCFIICPPSPYLNSCSKLMNPPVLLGAQNCSKYNDGAYTGEVSALMLAENQCKVCIIGHSERRQIFNETNEDIKLKAENLLKNDINPIICVGETLEEKEGGSKFDIIQNQITNSMPKNASKHNIIVAYEPIWAIGTGLTPSLEDISEIHSFIKKSIKGFDSYKVLYGGSVKSVNSEQIMKLKDVDGLLVGGASLNPHEFIKIMTS
jgi:triosephosphate isomerase